MISDIRIKISLESELGHQVSNKMNILMSLEESIQNSISVVKNSFKLVDIQIDKEWIEGLEK